MPSYATALLCLALSTTFGFAQADSSVFSQFIGATTASSPDLGESSYLFTGCTDYIHGLPALTGLASSISAQLEQVAVDGVCEFCTGLSQSRIDSCCGVATSSACFDQFADSHAAQATPASVSATATGLSGDLSATASSSPNGGVIAQNKDLFASSFVAAMIGFVGWIL